MDARVVAADGHTVLALADQRVESLAYLRFQPEPRYVRQMLDAGVRIFFIGGGVDRWPSEDRFDLSDLHRSLDVLHAEQTDLFVVVRFTISTPGWFPQRYPQEVLRFAHVPGEQQTFPEYVRSDKGGARGALHASYASGVWRAWGRRYVEAVVECVNAHGMADRVIGYMVNTGGTGEGLLWGVQEGLYGDFSAPGVAALRQWLTRRYGSDGSLRRAWGRDDVTLDTAEPPLPQQRRRASLGELRHPVADGWKIDYDRFQSDLMVDALLEWCGHARRLTGGKKLVGCFYGYTMWQTGMVNELPSHGHCALARMLDAPQIDFVSGITSYWNRGMGRPGSYMLPVGSVNLHGKLHWNEEDLRTHLLWSDDRHQRMIQNVGGSVPRAAQDAVWAYRRQLARRLVEPSQSWLFDMTGGWYDAPELLEEFTRQSQILERLSREDGGSCAEVACVVSERSAYYHRHYLSELYQERGQAQSLRCDLATEELYRAGVPLDWYLSSDLPTADLSRYRVVCFFNLVMATQAERAAVERLKADGRTLVFLWAPGYLSEADAGVALSMALTGIAFAPETLRGPGQVRITDFTTPMTRELTDAAHFGTQQVFEPLLVIDDTGATVFGQWVVNGAPAAAFKRFSGWTSVVLGTSTSHHRLMRAVFRDAGCGIRCESGDIVFENRSFFGLHACKGGPMVVRLADCEGLDDLYSGRRFMQQSGLIHLGSARRAGDTRLYRKLRGPDAGDTDTSSQSP